MELVEIMLGSLLTSTGCINENSEEDGYRTHDPVQLDLVHDVLQLRLGGNAPHVRVVARGPQLVDLLLLDVQVGERLVQLVSRLALLGDRAVCLGLDLGHPLVEVVVLLLGKGELVVALLQVGFRATEADAKNNEKINLRMA